MEVAGRNFVPHEYDVSVKFSELPRPNVPVFFPEEPLHIVRGSGQYLYDEQGHRILDCINNVCHGGFMIVQ